MAREHEKKKKHNSGTVHIGAYRETEGRDDKTHSKDVKRDPPAKKSESSPSWNG